MSRYSNSPHNYGTIPEREYYVASRRNRRRNVIPLFLVVLGILLFCSGFLLGKASAAQNVSPLDTESSVPVTSLPQFENNDGDSTEQTPESTGSSLAKAVGTGPAWNLILVNGAHPLPEDFQIPELTQLRKDHAIDSRSYPALQ